MLESYIIEEGNLDENEPLIHSTSESYSSVSDNLSLNNEIEVISPKNSKKQWITIITLVIGIFSVNSVGSLQAPFFPVEAEKKGATSSEYGFIFGAFQLTVCLFAPVIGRLVIYIPPQILLNCGILTVGVSCVSFGTLGFIQGRIEFVSAAALLRIVEGVGACALRTSCLTIIASQFSERLATMFVVLDISKCLGLIMGPVLGGFFYDIGGYGLPFYCVGSIVIIDAAVIYFVLPSVEKPTVPERRNVLSFCMHYTVLMYSLCVVTGASFACFIQATMEPHIREFKLSGLKIGMFFTLVAIAYSVTAPIWGRINDKKWCNSRISCFIGVLFAIASLLLLGPAPFFDFKLNIALAVTSVVLLGLSLAAKFVSSFNGTVNDTIQRGFPSDISTHGLISSVFAFSQGLGGFLGPTLGGILVDKIGFRDTTMVLLGFEIILAILLLISFCMKNSS